MSSPVIFSVWSPDPDCPQAGCPHLPECPPEWPFDKDQWLAFDLGPILNPNVSILLPTAARSCQLHPRSAKCRPFNPEPRTLNPKPLASGTHFSLSRVRIRYHAHPTPCTRYSTPSTLHPRLYTPDPTPPTLHPKAYTLHPTPYSLHPTLNTLHSTPYTLHSKASTPIGIRRTH